MNKQRVVITGAGCVTPIGVGLAQFTKGLMDGVSGANIITRFDPENFKTRFACEVKNFDPLHFFEVKEARKMDRFSQYGMAAAMEAMENARVDESRLVAERSGVIWSSGIGGFETFETETQSRSSQDGRLSPFFITKIIPNHTAGMLSIKYGLRGPSVAPVSACASSTQAIIEAFNYIRWGKGDFFIAGGSEAPVTPASIAGFNSMKALSVNNDAYETACRPFDKTRDGFVIGEGAGALIIESLEHAEKRGAPPLAEITGGGQTSDAYHITGTHPEGLGAFLAMKEALKEAQTPPSAVDYINAHATSTPPGDLSETLGIARLFGQDINRVHISSTKSMTGHLLGAAGAVEAIATILAIAHNMIPPTINTCEPDDRLPSGVNLCLERSVPREVNVAMSNSFGFGGHCAAVVFKKLIN